MADQEQTRPDRTLVVPPYGVIYADPPWQFDNRATGGSHKSGAAQKYPVLSVTDLAELHVDETPIKGLGDQASALFLWTTNAMLPDALWLLEEWGFRYKTMLTWVKTGRLGMGYWFRNQTEHLLVGVQGDVKAFRLQRQNVIAHPVLGHSEKPEAFRLLIEEATRGLTNQRRIELFARKRVAGWDAWGLELEGGCSGTAG